MKKKPKKRGLHYSGPSTKRFWYRVNQLSPRGRYALYDLGVALQSLESFVIARLQQEEIRAKK